MNNPFLKKFAEYASFKKYEYREVSKPNQSISERFTNFKKIFLDWSFKTTYLKDIKYLNEKCLPDVYKSKKLYKYYLLYRFSELAMGIYCIKSIMWHYKKGYFNTSSKLTEFYIVGKIIFVLFTISAVSFFALKTSSDSILYEYYSLKENEWDKMIDNKKEENEYIMEYVAQKEKKNVKKAGI
jgi:hypothetical protein